LARTNAGTISDIDIVDAIGRPLTLVDDNSELNTKQNNGDKLNKEKEENSELNTKQNNGDKLNKDKDNNSKLNTKQNKGDKLNSKLNTKQNNGDKLNKEMCSDRSKSLMLITY